MITAVEIGGGGKQMTSLAGHFDGHGDAPMQYRVRISQCIATRALPEATERCHRVTTRYVSPWRPPEGQPTQQLCKMYPLCWPFRWPLRGGGTIPRTLPDGGGSWLS